MGEGGAGTIELACEVRTLVLFCCGRCLSVFPNLKRKTRKDSLEGKRLWNGYGACSRLGCCQRLSGRGKLAYVNQMPCPLSVAEICWSRGVCWCCRGKVARYARAGTGCRKERQPLSLLENLDASSPLWFVKCAVAWCSRNQRVHALLVSASDCAVAMCFSAPVLGEELLENAPAGRMAELGTSRICFGGLSSNR